MRCPWGAAACIRTRRRSAKACIRTQEAIQPPARAWGSGRSRQAGRQASPRPGRPHLDDGPVLLQRAHAVGGQPPPPLLALCDCLLAPHIAAALQRVARKGVAHCTRRCGLQAGKRAGGGGCRQQLSGAPSLAWPRDPCGPGRDLTTLQCPSSTQGESCSHWHADADKTSPRLGAEAADLQTDASRCLTVAQKSHNRLAR